MKHKQKRQYAHKVQKPQRASPSAADRQAAATADPAIQPVWLDLQRSLGNQATAHLMHDIQLPAVSRQVLPHVFRQAAEKESVAAIDPAGLGLERELLGHPQGGQGQQAGPAPAAVAPQLPAANTGVRVVLSVLAPEEDCSQTAAQIAAAHNRPGAAGWTTPRYQITVSDIKPFNIDVDVTLAFKMELASEFAGVALQVLRDHEQGHIKIGAGKAEQHLKRGLEAYLQGLPGFANTASVQQGFVSAAASFSAAEGQESMTYDASDYPRMTQAYYGARTPLADLAQTFPAIATASATLHDLAALAQPVERAQVPAAAQAAISACNLLSKDEKAMLQYNPEFKALVDKAVAAIGMWMIWLDRAAESDSAAVSRLDALTSVLEGFDWKPPV